MTAVLQKEGYALIGAAMEVYNKQGQGSLEEVYQECLEIELSLRGIPFVSQAPLSLAYKGRTLRRNYRPDLVVYDEIIVELKDIRQLTDADTAQLLNYLKATGKRVGYLINFGHTEGLEWKRFIL